MTIIVTCQCGQQFRAEDTDAGMQAQCPQCRQLLVIPGMRVREDSSTASSRQSNDPKAHSRKPILVEFMPHIVSFVVVIVGCGLLYVLSQSERAGRIISQGQRAAGSDSATSLGIDLSDFERTREWVLEQNRRLDGIRREGNAIRLDDARMELERKLQGHVGKEVLWQIAVAQVDNDQVVLEDHWARTPNKRTDEKATSFNSGCYLALGYGQDPTETNALIFNRATVALRVGQQISRAEAAQLNHGDCVTLHASIEKITVSPSGCILIRLGEAERPQESAQQRPVDQRASLAPARRQDQDTPPSESPSPVRKRPPVRKPGAFSVQPSDEASEPKTAIGPELSVAPLENGVVIDNDLSVAIAKIDRRPGPTFAGTGKVDTEHSLLVISFAFRRVSAAWYKSPSDVRSREFYVVARDDRGNEYQSPSFHFDSLAGTPHDIERMPVGFTWTSDVSVQMPQGTPIEKIYLWRERFRDRFQQSEKGRFAMSISKPTVPDFRCDIPSHMAIAEGATIQADRNIRGKMGPLTIRDSFAAKDFGLQPSGPARSVSGLLLSLPIEFTNADYNARGAAVPRLWVQFASGQAIDADGEDVFQSIDLQNHPDELCAATFEIPGKSSRTVVLRVGIMASMNAKAGLNLRALLLYADGHFRGFVSIPDDMRERIRTIAGNGQPKGSDEDGEPSEKPAGQGPLSGTWQASTGASFRIDDDGTTVTITLDTSDFLREFSGTLTRRDNAPDSKSLTGTVDAVFRPDSPKRYTIHATGTLDDPNHLALRFTDWPAWNNAGRNIGKKIFKETLTRSNGEMTQPRPSRKMPSPR